MKKDDFIRIGEDTQIVVRPGDITLNPFVNTVTFKNSGTVDMYINEDKIVAGTYKSFAGEPRSILDATFTIKWRLQSPAPTTITRMATVTQLFYINKDIR